MNRIKCKHCKCEFMSKSKFAEYCQRPACQKERRRVRVEYQKAYNKQNREQINKWRVEHSRKKKEHNELEITQDTAYSNEPCRCGCGKPRRHNRWYAPDCSRWLNAPDQILGGECYRNGLRMPEGRT